MRPEEFDGLLEEVLQEMADAEPGASLGAGVMARVGQQRMGQRWAGWGTAAVLASGMLGVVLLHGIHEKEKGPAGGGGVEVRAMVGGPIKAEAVTPIRAEKSSKSSRVHLKARQVRPSRAERNAEQALMERGLEITPLEVSSLALKPLARE